MDLGRILSAEEGHPLLLNERANLDSKNEEAMIETSKTFMIILLVISHWSGRSPATFFAFDV
jgi:hypothetical protein